MQFEALSGAHQQRQRIVRLLVVAKRVDPHVRRCFFRQRCGNRVVLEYQDVVEQGLADPPCPALDVIQRRVLELTQCQVLALHRLQPVAKRLLRTRAGDHRQGVDEQADLFFDPAQLRRTTGHGGTEGHGVLPGVALQQYQPGCLDQGIERHLLLAGERCQALARGGIQVPVAIGMALDAPHPTGDRRNQQGRLAQPQQALLPERLGATRVLALQPGDVVAIAPARARRRLAAVALQDFTEQLRVAPAVHEDVMVGVDQVVPALAGTHQHQPQQRRLGEFEAEPGLAGREDVERLGDARAVAPVVHAERHFDALAHQLQRLLQRALPEEAAAQGFVGIQRRLPSLAEALGIQTFHVQTHLVDVVAAVLLVQAMEQHALLHRRQRIEILHLTRRQGQGVQLPLVEPGQGEVRWGHAFDTGGATMLDQRQQLVAIGIGQANDARLAETRGAEAPVDTEPAGIDLAVEAQPVVQRRVAVALAAGRVGAGTEQRGGIGGEAAVELPQVVEGDARTRQGRQRRPILGAAEVTQDAEAQSLVRNRAQLFLDPLDRSAQLRHRRQAQREQAGEPAHRAGQVDVFEQFLAAVSFELDEGIRLAAPATDDPRQRGKQQIVDLGPVGRRRFLQQPARGLFAQLGTCRTDMPERLRALAIVAGQFGGHAFELRQPVAALALQAAVAGMRLQAFGPRLEGAGLGGQRNGLAGLQLAVGGLQVFEQDPPGHPIHRQVVDHQQQPLAAVSECRQQRAQQRPVAQVEAALGLLRQGFQRLPIGDRALPQQRLAGLDRAVFGAPAPVFETEAQAQRIMVRQQGLQRLFQQRTVERLPRFQQDRLVPVLAPRNILLEEHLLDGQQRRAPADRPLFGAGQAAALDGHAGQAADRLVQEQVPGRQPDPDLARAADHLDGNDRVAAKFEEVVVQADAAKLQHIRPDRRQALLQLAARRGIILLQTAGVRRGQGTPVQLAVGRQRQALEEQQVGGHHVLRQARLQGLAQRIAQRGGVAWRRLRHDIADQLRSARSLVRQHRYLGHARLFEQAGLDFAQFDAEAANLDLVVDPTDVFDHPVATIASQVAGPVQTSPGRGERIGHEARATQLGAVQIAPRQSRAPHIQLADAAPGHRVQPGVEQIP
ncbi:hypothetical protein CLJ1_2811 [Pseudomonas paraeruginosa]|nr:hypothetical protein CLJ1_2811 [Pseudomonas aeruginosa]